jgi:hypothetical protein
MHMVKLKHNSYNSDRAQRAHKLDIYRAHQTQMIQGTFRPTYILFRACIHRISVVTRYTYKCYTVSAIILKRCEPGMIDTDCPSK